jgi:hypothetical protein
VLLDGVRHDHQLVGDLLVGLSRAQQSQHLQLAVPTMCGHLLLWRAPATIRSLSPLPCRSSSTDRCGDRWTCELASWNVSHLAAAVKAAGAADDIVLPQESFIHLQ